MRSKILFTFLLFSSATLFAQEPNLSFSILNGDFTRCAEDSLVNIRIVPDPDKTFSTITLFWDGDNIDPVTITDPAQLEQGYTYDFPDLFDNCDYSDRCISRGIYGSCFLIEVVATYTDGTNENVSRRIGFQKPPEPRFNLPSTTCTGTMLDIPNLTCPGNDTSMTYLWTLPDGSTSTDFEVSYEFLATGPQTVRLAATNLCGTRVISRTIDIVQAPDVTAIPDSNVFVGVDNDFRVCLDGESCIRLNGSASTGIDSWRWTVDNPVGVSIEDPESLITRVCFTSPGERTFTLRGTNSSCNESEEHPCPVTVLEGESLTLNPQPDACPQLDYTPEPSVDPDATYFIDGVVVSSFPFTMTPRSTPYVIRAEKSTECGDLVARDTLFVDPAIQPTLLSPNDGDAYCPDESLVALEVSDPGGSWSNSSSLVFQDGMAFFDRSAPAGAYPLTYTLGSGDCERTLNFTLSIEPTETLDFSPQADACPELQYSPLPGIDPAATYFIDGVEVSAFPVLLSARSAPYVIRAEKNTSCDNLVAHDTLFIDPAIQPTLVSPADGDLFCPNDTGVPLEVSDAGGTWTPAEGLMLDGEDAFFDRSVPPGRYDFTYTLGEDACERTLTFSLEIADSELQLPADFTICATGDPVALAPSPGDGTLSGTGVSDSDRTFSPAGLVPGNYAITYSRDNTTTGCTESGSWTAEVIAEPTVEAGAPIELCNADQSIQLLDFTAGFVADPPSAILSFSGRGITDGSTGAYRPGSLPVGTVDTVLITSTDPRTPDVCAATDTLLVTITEIVTPNAGADTTICGGDDTFFLGDPAGGRWSGPNASADGTVNLSGLSPSTYVYTLSLGAGICQSSDEMVLTIVPGDGVTAATDQLFVCDTAAVVQLPVTTPSQGGVWSGDLPLAGTNIDVSGAAVGTYDFRYLVSSLPEGCNSADLRLDILPRPTTTLRGDSVRCNDGSCVTFRSGGTAADRYRWSTSDGFRGTGDSICHQFPAAGDYSVRLAGERLHPVDGSLLCSSPTVTTSIRILDPLQPATITVDQDTICPGEALTLRFSPPPNANLESLAYEWRYGNTTIPASGPTDIFLPSPLQDTSYRISLHTLGTCGDAQQSFEVFVRANPRANIRVVYPENCSGSELILTNLATGTLDETIWFSSDGQRYTSFQPPVLTPVTGDSARTILYSLVAGNSCLRDTFSVPVTVEPTSIRALPALVDTTICPGEPFIVTNISTPGTRAEYVFSDGRRFGGDSIAVVFDEPGPFSFVLYAYGCGYDSSVWSGTVLPEPDLDFTAPAFACPYDEVPYVLSSSAANTLIYFGDGDSTSQNIGTHRYAPSSDRFLIRYAATSGNGCRAEGEQFIDLLPQPLAAIGPLDSLCAGEEQTVVSLGSGGQTCRWTFPDGTVADGCSVSHAFTERGLSALQLIYTSANGCTDTAVAPVFVRPTPEVALDVSFDDSDCGPTEVRFFYRGDLQDVSSFRLLTGDGSAPINGLNPVHRYDTSGQVTARLRTGFDDVCFDDTELTFYLRQYPRAEALTEDERCELEDRASVVIRTENPEDLISGSGPNGYFENGINRFNLLDPGDYIFEVVSPDGCDTLIDYTLNPVRPLELSTIEDAQIELGDSIQLTSFVNSSDVMISWVPGRELSDSTVLSPTARPTRLTTYIITALDTVTNCVRRDTVTISPSQDNDMFVPTSFSPNEDGVNDVFQIFPKVSVDRVEVVRIWDRWGNLVYELKGTSTNPINQFTPLWDGTFNGRPLNSAVFVYQVIYHTIRGQRKVLRGDLTLLARFGR
ncbi:T9SS type B sorting domain-containing protein [Lewinella sp. W8]|uniref:T9SS type B sorting domain-containing protein n=1 Tax=Lewinella sp. W8 TaxID=2528208 RepID=UPI001068C325|nr:T9SS type B sorting domain-containing protein [Lewinella sp. W8]MTB51448.1 T9SS type B sorting domain-containing protein [Lewinella sp. W8]